MSCGLCHYSSALRMLLLLFVFTHANKIPHGEIFVTKYGNFLSEKKNLIKLYIAVSNVTFTAGVRMTQVTTQ